MNNYQMQIDILNIVVLTRDCGTDKVIIYTTNLPPSVYPYKNNSSLTLDVERGKGAQYVRDNFKIEPEVITV